MIYLFKTCQTLSVRYSVVFLEQHVIYFVIVRVIKCAFYKTNTKKWCRMLCLYSFGKQYPHIDKTIRLILYQLTPLNYYHLVNTLYMIMTKHQ